MGQKVNPLGLRVKITRTWDSVWYAGKDYSSYVIEDQIIKKFLKERVKNAGLSKVLIERTGEKVNVRLLVARPGIVIGKKGADIDVLRKDVENLVSKKVAIDIQEVRRPEADALLVAESIADQLVRRVAFRRTMKKAVSSALRFGVQGIKVSCSGRLGGAEMSRCEWIREGRVPLHTLRADVDYALAEAKTTYGIIGVKVWIFKGEVLDAKESPSMKDNR